MKAIVRDRYGSTDVLRLEEVPQPIPRDDAMLVRICAASINASDWEVLRGDPAYVRMVGFGVFRPKVAILGSDIAGRVEAVGKNVTKFKPGDEICADLFACGLGGFAEYVCVPESAPIAHKPPSLTFDEAATVPQAGLIAMQGLRDRPQVGPGKQVLINGAGGSAGTFAIQIAKMLGAEVTGVDRVEKLDLLESLGADHVIDYAQGPFTANGQRYDLILDLVGPQPLWEHRNSLNDGGAYLTVGGTTKRLLQALFAGVILSLIGPTKMGILAVRPNAPDLRYVLEELLVPKKIAPVIDRRYPLDEVPAAMKRHGDGLVRGKLVIQFP